MTAAPLKMVVVGRTKSTQRQGRRMTINSIGSITIPVTVTKPALSQDLSSYDVPSHSPVAGSRRHRRSVVARVRLHRKSISHQTFIFTSDPSRGCFRNGVHE